MRMTSHYISINYSCTKVAKCKPVTVLSIVLVTMNMSNYLPLISRFHTALTTNSQHCKTARENHLQHSDLQRYHTSLSLDYKPTRYYKTIHSFRKCYKSLPSNSINKHCLMYNHSTVQTTFQVPHVLSLQNLTRSVRLVSLESTSSLQLQI